MSRGTLTFSDAPHRPSRATTLQAPLVAAGNAMVAAALYLPWRTVDVRWPRPLAEVVEPLRGSGRPIVYYSWHAYEPFLFLAFRNIPRNLVPLAVGHDGFTSRLLHGAATAYGIRVWVYRRRSPVPPARQILDMLRRDRPIASLVADAGAAPRTVRKGFVDMVREAEAHLVPIAVRARRRIPLARPWRYGFPLPFTGVEVRAGAALDGREVTPESCRRALEAVE